jgi:hypothetical protein
MNSLSSIHSHGFYITRFMKPPFPTSNLVYNFSSLTGTSTTTNGANITTWRDTRTNLLGSYATAVYHTDTTINSKPTVTGCVTTTYGNNTTPQNSWSFYCVLRTGSTALSGVNNLTNNDITYSLQITLNGGSLQCCYSYVGWTVGTGSTWVASTNTNYILTVICSGSNTTNSSTQTYTFRVNGVDVTPVGNTDSGKHWYIINPVVGNSTNTTQTYMGEQILYKTNHSVSDAQTMEQYLSNKWGIGIGATPTVAPSSPYV